MEMSNEEHEEMIENLLDETVSTGVDETVLESTKTNDLIVATLPDNSGITLVKREIIYDEKELSKTVDLSSKITRVAGVTEDRLKECLEVLLKSNPNTVINSIGYSREKKEITFVADKDLDLEEFYILNSSNVKNAEENNDIIKLLNSVTFIEKKDENDNFEKYVSLFDLARVIDGITKRTNLIKNTESKINLSLKRNSDFNTCISDYWLKEEGCLDITIRTGEASTYFLFYVKDDDLFIKNVKDNAKISNEILLTYGEDLKSLMLNMKLVEEFYKCNESFYGSNLVVQNQIKHKKLMISNEFVDIKVSFPEISYEYNALSYKTIQVLKSNVQNLLKKIYVSIEECPIFLRTSLTEYKVNGVNNIFNEVNEEEIEKNTNEPVSIMEKTLGDIFRNPFKKQKNVR